MSDDNVKNIGDRRFRKQMENMAKSLRRNLMNKYTPHGESLVEVTQDSRGKELHKEIGLPVVKLKPVEVSFDLRDAIRGIYELAMAIDDTRRQIPVLRSEALGQLEITKKQLRKLVSLGLLKEISIKVGDRTKPNAKSRWMTVVFFTAQGRAYVREHFDPDYGLSK